MFQQGVRRQGVYIRRQLCQAAFSSVAYDTSSQILLPRTTNQAYGLASFAIDFLSGRYDGPGEKSLQRVVDFHTDSVICGISALACKTDAPNILRKEALQYPTAGSSGACVFGSTIRVHAEKAVVANVSAVREWDSNGTVFGYNEQRGAEFQAGEFGHNDYYPVVVAACQEKAIDGHTGA